MRLNRSTIILLVVSLVVIIGVLIVNNSQTTAPGGTTPSASQQTGGPLFAGITANTLIRFEVRDNTTGQRTVFTRASEDVWGLDEGGESFPPEESALLEVTAEADDTTVNPQDTFTVDTTTGQELDQNVLLTDIDSFLTLNANDSFESSDLESFGLTHPNHSIIATSEDGTVYVLHVGGENPSGNRYYAVLEQLSGADVSEDGVSVTEEPAAVATTILGSGDDQAQPSDNIQGAELEEAVEDAGDEGAVPAVEDVTEAAELSAMLDATNIAAGESAATDEAVAAAATDDAGEAVATQLVEESEAAAEPEAETTAEFELTAEVTASPAPEPTATLAPLAEPVVTLEGAQTIYTLPKSTLDTLITLLTAPPMVIPTAAPTAQIPLPEVTLEVTQPVEVTIPVEQVTPSATDAVDAEATEAAESTETPAS